MNCAADMEDAEGKTEEDVALGSIEDALLEDSSQGGCNDLQFFSDPAENFTNDGDDQSWLFCDDISGSVDITAMENLILELCVEYLPLKKTYCGQCRNYIGLAQDEIVNRRYGHAIARFKDFSSFIDNFAVSKAKSDFSTGKIVELKTLATERIAFCYLLKNSPCVAVKYANHAIVQKPVVAQSHLWRAIGYRRLNKLSLSLRSLTIFGALTSASLESCPYQFEEQKVIAAYWKMVLIANQQAVTSVKLLHFPSYNLNVFPKREQEERMSVTFLMNFPLYNSLIYADSSRTHLLPVGNGTFQDILQEQRQAYGFMNDQEDARYFADLPKDNCFLSSAEEHERFKQLTSEEAKLLWDASAFINSTCCQMSLQPGKGLHEHLLYCYALVNEEKFDDVLPEYEYILADLALFPVMSDEEWADELSILVDANIEMVESAIDSIKEYKERATEASRNIEQIKQWLELNERKFRVSKLQRKGGNDNLMDGNWSPQKRRYSSPKKKTTPTRGRGRGKKGKRNSSPGAPAIPFQLIEHTGRGIKI